jgi:type IV secretion system protein VirB10
MKDNSSQDDILTKEPEIDPGNGYPSPNDAEPDSGLRATPSMAENPSSQNFKETIVAPPSFSSVATASGSKKLILIGMSGVVLLGMYFIFKEISNSNKVEKTPSEKIQERSQLEAQKIIKEAKPISSADELQVVRTPNLPETPPIQAPQPPDPPPPPVPSVPQAPIFPQINTTSEPAFSPQISTDVFAGREDDEARLKALEARRKSSIMVLGGSNADSGNKPKEDKDKPADNAAKDKSSFLGFGEGAFGGGGLAKTKATQVKATQIGDLGSLIAQGKIIHAVLETAINTDLPGTLRAIITRDVYAEAGNNVLIPKGSRAIGKYETQVKSGQVRVGVMWGRLIRPDGVDIAIESQGTDTLGRSGIAGYLDDKFFTKLGNAFLVSFMVPAITEKIFRVKGQDDPIQTTTSTNALLGPTVSTTKTTTFKQEQLKESSDKFNEIIGKTIQDSFATTPTIFIDQGTEVNIFVNRDLIFPSDAMVGGAKMVR